MLAPQSWVWHAAFSPDGKILATVGDDRNVRFWDAETGQSIRSPLPHASAVLGVAFHPNGRDLLTSSDDGTVRIWDLKSPLRPDRQMIQTGPGHDLAFSRDGRLATASGRTVRVWNRTDGSSLTAPMTHTKDATSISFDPLGDRIATGDAGGTVRTWDARTASPLGKTLEMKKPVRRVIFSPDGKLLAAIAVSHDDRFAHMKVWDIAKDRVLFSFDHRGYCPFVVAFRPDSLQFATGGSSLAKIWDIESRQMLHELKHRGDVWSVAFSPDGQRLATACSDSSLNGLYAQVWNANTGVPTGPQLPHSDGVLVVAFSPDGKRVITGGDDKVARIWDAATGRPMTPSLTHRGVVFDAEFSADGRFVMTRTSSVHIWESETGHPVAIFPSSAIGGSSARARFSPDSRSVVTTAPDGAVRVWQLDADDRDAAVWVRQAQFHTGHRIDPTGSLTPLSGAELAAIWQSLNRLAAN